MDRSPRQRAISHLAVWLGEGDLQRFPQARPRDATKGKRQRESVGAQAIAAGRTTRKPCSPIAALTPLRRSLDPTRLCGRLRAQAQGQRIILLQGLAVNAQLTYAPVTLQCQSSSSADLGTL
jgi:hypothetical protein